MRRIATVLLVLTVAAGAPSVPAAESPDAQVNPVTGMIEIADPVWVGDHYDIRYSVDPGDKDDTSDVSTHPADDRRPRMAIAPDGDGYIVWWREVATPQVLIRRHNHSDGSWSAESVLSSTDLPGRNPEIVHDGTGHWVAYTEHAAFETRIRLGAIEDLPDPFGGFTTIASTTYGGDLDLRLHAASGHLWVTWVDSDLDVAWMEYDHASVTWGNVGYDSYADDSTKHALARIRETVLGN